MLEWPELESRHSYSVALLPRHQAAGEQHDPLGVRVLHSGPRHKAGVTKGGRLFRHLLTSRRVRFPASRSNPDYLSGTAMAALRFDPVPKSTIRQSLYVIGCRISDAGANIAGFEARGLGGAGCGTVRPKGDACLRGGPGCRYSASVSARALPPARTPAATARTHRRAHFMISPHCARTERRRARLACSALLSSKRVGYRRMAV